jgi:hypothetical protein
MLDEKGSACLQAARSPRRPIQGSPRWPRRPRGPPHRGDARHEGKRLFHVEGYALLIKAWNAFAKGQTLRRLYWSSQEPFPRIVGLQA